VRSAYADANERFLRGFVALLAAAAFDADGRTAGAAEVAASTEVTSTLWLVTAAIFLRVCKLGGWSPLSNRDMAEWLVPTRRARPACDKFRSILSRINARATCSYGRSLANSSR